MRGRGAGLAVATALTLLGGCSPDPGSAPAATTATTKAASPTPPGSATSPRTSGRATAERTTSTLGPFPPVLSSGPSAVDSSAIRSLADLPAVFQCPAAVPPITVPPTRDAPEGLVCTSRLAGDETLYLWYAPDPDERYRALQAALAKAKYVRGGPNWVAGGTVDSALGDVGGEVYK